MLRTSARFFRALVFVAATSCGTSPGPASTPPDCKAGLPTKDACATNAPSYATDIAPLVEARCLGCHFKGNPNSSVVLETQAEMSQQTQLVETQIYRCEMPPADGGIPLTDTERTELLQWLVCGAPNN